MQHKNYVYAIQKQQRERKHELILTYKVQL